MTVLRPSAVRVGFYRLKHVRMVADDDRCAGVEHLVRDLDIFRAGRGRVLDAPVNGNDEQIALGAGGFDGFNHAGFIHSGGTAGFAGIWEEIDVRLIVLVGVAVAVEPAGHAEPADLDAVGLE